MGFFWFSFLQILRDSRRPTPSVKGDWGTPMEALSFTWGAIWRIALCVVWFVGIPYYFHVIQDFSGWATFGIWMLISAAFAALLQLLGLTE